MRRQSVRPAAAVAPRRVAGATSRRTDVAAAEPQAPMSAAYTTPAGYGSAPSAWWGQLAQESTPELRWPQRTGVFERMRTDSQVQAAMRAVTTPIERTRFYLDQNGSPDEVVQHVSTDLGLPIGLDAVEGVHRPRRRGRFSWAQHMHEALVCLPQGHSFFEQLYALDEDAGLYHLRKLAYRRPETISAINVADDGGLVSIEQHRRASLGRPVLDKVTIGVERLVAYVPDREGGNWTGRSLLRSAYPHWLLKDRLMRVQAETIERNGMGVPRYTDVEHGNATTLAAGREMASAWRAGSVAGAGLPHGAKLDLVGVSGTLPNAERAIRYHDEKIAVSVLAHFLNLGQQTGTGSYALGETFADFFVLSLQTIADHIVTTANEHVIEDLVDINYGPDVPAPIIRFDEVGSRAQASADALKVLKDAGILQPDRLLEEHVRQQLGLPAKQQPGTPGSAIPATDDVVVPDEGGVDV